MSAFIAYAAFIIVVIFAVFGAVGFFYIVLPFRIVADEYDEPDGDASLLDRSKS